MLIKKIPTFILQLSDYTEAEVSNRIKYALLVLLLPAGLFIYNAYPEDTLPPDVVVDKIVVAKSERKLLVYANGQLLKKYKIALGKNPIGAKQYEGDNKTPEGVYYINAKTATSKFHKNLGISYPNDTNLINATHSNKSAGGDIKIHGLQNGLGIIGHMHTLIDWTAGCIAITNKEIDDLYCHTSIGTVVEIKP